MPRFTEGHPASATLAALRFPATIESLQTHIPPPTKEAPPVLNGAARRLSLGTPGLLRDVDSRLVVLAARALDLEAVLASQDRDEATNRVRFMPTSA